MCKSNPEEIPRITDEEIAVIKRAQAGDERAFSWIFNHYKDFVDNILYGYIRDWDEARDITNIVFLKVHDKLSKFTTYESFGGWLRILTNHVAIDYLRIKGNHRNTLGDDDVKVTESETNDYSEEGVVNHLLTERIFEVLDTYGPKVRTIFELFYIDNMPMETIATKLRLPLGTVKSILSRGRKKLQKTFNKQQQ